MEARARKGQKNSPDEANQVIQNQAWQDEVDCAQQGQRETFFNGEGVLILWINIVLQSCLLASGFGVWIESEKAAAEFQLKEEVKRLHEAQVRRRSSLRFIYVHLLLSMVLTRKFVNLLIHRGRKKHH